MTTKVCRHCGLTFEPVPSNRAYCTPECWTALRKKQNAKKCLAKYYRNHEANKARLREDHRKHRAERLPVIRARWRQTREKTPWKHIMEGAKHRAKVSSVPFDLTDEWASARWTGFCELSGIEFHLMLRTEDTRMFAASVDRIEPKLGYTQSNCRFILFAVNCARQNGTDADLLRIAKGLVQSMSK